jgi:hypothetical protein
MITTTYFSVEQKTFNSREGLGVWGWSKVWVNGRKITDRAEAEALLEEKKNDYCRWLADELAKATDRAVVAHLGKLISNVNFRIVEDTKTFTHASLYGYSDVDAYEIVKVISDKTIEIRKMDTEHDISHLKQSVGGFFGHVENQRNQKVTYASNPDAEVIRIRRKKNNPEEWCNGNLRFGLTEKPYAFYDYNF